MTLAHCPYCASAASPKQQTAPILGCLGSLDPSHQRYCQLHFFPKAHSQHCTTLSLRPSGVFLLWAWLLERLPRWPSPALRRLRNPSPLRMRCHAASPTECSSTVVGPGPNQQGNSFKSVGFIENLF